jgi:hypothetical protein
VLFFPFFLGLGAARFAENLDLWFGFIVLAAGIGIIVSGLLLKQRMYIVTLVGAAVLGFIAFILPLSEVNRLIVFGVGLVPLIRITTFQVEKWYFHHAAIIWAGIMVHFAAYIIFSHNQILEPYAGSLVVTGVLSVFALVFLSNRANLQGESEQKSGSIKIPIEIRRLNRRFIVVFMSILIGIFIIPGLAHWTRSLVLSIIQSILMWIEDLLAFGTTTEQPPANQEEMTLPEVEGTAADGGLWDMIKELLIIAVMVLSLMVLAVFALILLYKLGRILVRGFKKLMLMLSSNRDLQYKQQSVAYVDEEVSLLDNSWKSGLRDKWLSRLRIEKEPKWSELQSNQARIRYLYKHLVARAIKSGFTWKQHMTPSETFNSLSAFTHSMTKEDLEAWQQSYNKSRYSPSEPSAEEVNDMLRSQKNPLQPTKASSANYQPRSKNKGGG